MFAGEILGVSLRDRYLFTALERRLFHDVYVIQQIKLSTKEPLPGYAITFEIDPSAYGLAHDDRDTIATSFPQFFALMRDLGATLE